MQRKKSKEVPINWVIDAETFDEAGRRGVRAPSTLWLASSVAIRPQGSASPGAVVSHANLARGSKVL